MSPSSARMNTSPRADWPQRAASTRRRSDPAWDRITQEIQCQVRKVSIRGLMPSYLSGLEGQVKALAQRVDQLCEQPRACEVTIQTMAPEPYSLSAPLAVLVQSEPDSHIASFVDANVTASGDTLPEAIENLKMLMVDRLEEWAGTDAEKLGPEPTRQLAILRTFLSRQ